MIFEAHEWINFNDERNQEHSHEKYERYAPYVNITLGGHGDNVTCHIQNNRKGSLTLVNCFKLNITDKYIEIHGFENTDLPFPKGKKYRVFRFKQVKQK